MNIVTYLQTYSLAIDRARALFGSIASALCACPALAREGLLYGGPVVQFSSHNFRTAIVDFRFSLFIPRLSILVLRRSIFVSHSR